MDLRLLLGGAGAKPRRVRVSCDPDASVGSLAEAVLRLDPARGGPPPDTRPTLATSLSGDGPALDPATLVSESGIRSGAAVAVVPAPRQARTSAPAAAVLRVVAGPDRGREFPLQTGSVLLGRGKQCAIRLNDPLVSKVHARILVGEVVEIIDQNSSNGIEVDGLQVVRLTVKPDDTVTVGDTQFTVTVASGAREGSGTGTEVAFNRSPRIAPSYEGDTLEAPEPPSAPGRSRFPVIPMVVPVLMGGVLYLITQSLASIAFVAMSPLLMLGQMLETSLGGKRDYKRGVQRFGEQVAQLDRDCSQSHEQERAGRRAEQPATAEFVDALHRMSPLLWCRRPEQDAFLRLRIGLGQQQSRLTVELPSRRSGEPELWQQVDAVIERYKSIDGVPVVADLRDCGGLGVAGGGEAALSVARSVVMQLLLAHSPADVVVAAVASARSAISWEWLTWIPHVPAAEALLGVSALAATQPTGTRLAAAVHEQIRLRAASRATSKGGPTEAEAAIILLVSDDAPVNRADLVQIAEQGPAVGVHVIWFAASVERVPAACRTFVSAQSGATGDTAGFVRTASLVTPLTTEHVDGPAAEALARRLSAVTDAGARQQDDAGLAASVGYLALAGSEIADAADAVVERWQESGSLVSSLDAEPGRRRREGTLRALVGSTASEPLYLDLRQQGPHALVGGTTGSGKSEFLQTWVVSMAAAHSPNRVTFLLVDYKGGSAFADCVRLPHTVGLVTDLSPHLVRRALTSLNAELRHREHILNRKRAKDLIELERSGDPEAPPSLVIVVDEFAALVQEVPEFIDGVVNVAQRGRSLGLHLVLATQRPAGVIKDNLRANTNLRVALRMADEADSTDVVGEKVAAGFDPSLPGRAVVKTGPGRLTTFQAAYVGGWTPKDRPPPRVAIEDLGFGPGTPWPEPEAPAVTAAALGRSDIQRLVDTIVDASRAAIVPAPRKPWLPELADVYDLSALPTRRTDDEFVFGVADDPDAQAQPTVAFQPDRDGSMIVYGTGGSGKSAFLRAIAVAAGLTARGGPCEVYGLDFGARGLAPIEVLPHVGSVVSGEDEERVARLIRRLRQTVDERARRFAAANAGTISEYRKLADRPEERRILLLIDGLGAFRQAYEVGRGSRWFEMVQAIAADGRPVGVHVVVSADRPGAVPSGLASALQRRLVMRLANENDEAMLGLPRDVLTPESPPGRGVLDGREVQVAVLGRDASAPGQARALAKLAESMSRAGVVVAEDIRRLPERVSLSTLPVACGASPTLGIADETLQPVGFAVSGAVLVSGPPRSGRTTVMATLVASALRLEAGRRTAYLGSRRSPLRHAFAWDEVADTEDAVTDLATDLAARLAGEPAGPGRPGWIVVIEGIPDFLNTMADMPLQDVVKAARGNDHLLVCDGDTSALAGSWPLLQAVKSARSGIALQPDQMDGDTIFRTSFPRVTRADFPPGRGIWVHGGQLVRVQVAVPE